MINPLNQEVADKESTKYDDFPLENHPLFCLLNKKDVKDLLEFAKDERIPEGKLITKEGDLVDSVYFILTGTAQVTRNVSTIEKTISIKIAELHAGDTIGLAETGFFSHSGTRTATVVALTPMQLLKIDLEDFHVFMQKHTLTYPAFNQTIEKILMTNFISEIFSNLTISVIQQIAKQVNKISLVAGTQLFDKNEKCNKCYYLLHGTITLKNNQVKEVSSPAILLKKEFLAKSFCDVDGITNTDCELFVIDRVHVKKYLKRNSKFYRFLVKLFQPILKLTKKE